MEGGRSWREETRSVGTYYLIRHGETGANQAGVLQGHLDVPLAEKGKRQAEVVARALGVVKLEAVYSSDLSRARETAEAIAKLQGCRLVLDRRLRELDCGHMQGLTLSECRRRFPELFDALERDPVGTKRPGGESYRDVYQRSASALEEIRGNHPRGDVAVVSHGLVIKCLLAYASGEQPELRTPVVSNGSISVVRWDETGWRVLRKDCVDHLAPLAETEAFSCRKTGPEGGMSRVSNRLGRGSALSR